MRGKYRLKVDHRFECTNPFEMPSGSPMSVTWVNDRRKVVLIDFGCGRCGLFDQSVMELFEPVVDEELEVEQLGERIGYGRLMQLASEIWRRKDPSGALSVGPCYGTIEKQV